MLQHTFCHITGISLSGERALWARGIHSWDALESTGTMSTKVLDEVRRSREYLRGQDAFYFSTALPAREQWRLFPSFRHVTAYVDIETTGLGRNDHITTIALHDGRQTRTYVHEVNLDDFVRDIDGYRFLVTYNGKAFDVPVIERQFGIKLRQVHLDLMYPLRSLGIKGGLKGCEKTLGISREEVEGIDGRFAILLWQEYCRTGAAAVLESLLAYNMADAVNLELLAVMMYNRKIEESGAPASSIALPPPVPPRYTVDSAVIERLRERL